MGIENNIGNYSILLRQVKQRVALAQQRAIFAANEELLRMYWDLGHIMYKAQHAEGLSPCDKNLKKRKTARKHFAVADRKICGGTLADTLSGAWGQIFG